MTAPVPRAGDSPDDVLLVLEQTLGNRVHGRNLERTAAAAGVRSRAVRLDHRGVWWSRGRLGVHNWTVEASVRARQEVRRLLADRPCTALYVHTSLAGSLLLDVMRRVPTVVSTDATPANIDTVAGSYAHAVRGDRVEAAKRRLTRAVLRTASVVVAQSRWTADSVVRDYGIAPDRVRVLAQGADLARFAPGSRTGGLDGRPVRLLFVGGDFTRKGGPVLLEALRRLSHDVEVDLVTSAPVQAGALPAGVVVRSHCGLDHDSPQLFELFARADLFVLPSLGDASPLALGEALAAGLPVVATRVGAVPEMAVHGTTGLVVEPGSAVELAGALQTLVERRDLRLRMGVAARALAEQRYDCDRNNREVLQLLHAARADLSQELAS